MILVLGACMIHCTHNSQTFSVLPTKKVININILQKDLSDGKIIISYYDTEALQSGIVKTLSRFYRPCTARSSSRYAKPSVVSALFRRPIVATM